MSQKYRFKGRMLLTGKNIFFFLEGENHDEGLLYAFIRPLLKVDLFRQPGIMLGINEDDQPAATKILISTNEISDDEVQWAIGPKNVLVETRRFKKEEYLKAISKPNK